MLATPARALKKSLKELESRTQPKVWLSLAGNEDAARFSKQLVTVRDDAPVGLDLDRMRAGHEDRPAAVALFRRLGFRTLQREFESTGESVTAESAGGEGGAPAAPEPTARLSRSTFGPAVRARAVRRGRLPPRPRPTPAPRHSARRSRSPS